MHRIANDMEELRLRVWRYRDVLIAERDECDPATGDKARYRRVTKAMDEVDRAISNAIREMDRFLEEDANGNLED